MKVFPGLSDSVLADSSSGQASLTTEASQAIRRAEITNVEVLVMRTVIKSRKPAKRIGDILAEWSQFWGDDAKEMISKHITKMVSDEAYPAP